MHFRLRQKSETLFIKTDLLQKTTPRQKSLGQNWNQIKKPIQKAEALQFVLFLTHQKSNHLPIYSLSNFALKKNKYNTFIGQDILTVNNSKRAIKLFTEKSLHTSELEHCYNNIMTVMNKRNISD